jgi:hypothetical protein
VAGNEQSPQTYEKKGVRTDMEMAEWMDTLLGETFDIALGNLLTGEKGKSIDRYGHW